ncbi:MAG: hypothetical protein HOH04_14140 [Rhodospirillaceae bacterium]|jgi:hypothetical protein|nr:hypothetical protein [Rhodospirillaceae bacterium]
MKFVRYIGWVLLIAAFAAAAAEVLVPPIPGAASFFTSAYEVWYTGWPGSLVFTQIRVERVAPFLWDPVAVTLLSLPGWFVLGVPGVALSWMSRSKGFASRRKLVEMKRFEKAMMLYDDLAREARQQRMDDGLDDFSPEYSDSDTLDAIKGLADDAADNERFSMKRAEERRAQIDARRESDPTPQSPEPPEKN